MSAKLLTVKQIQDNNREVCIKRGIEWITVNAGGDVHSYGKEKILIGNLRPFCLTSGTYAAVPTFREKLASGGKLVYGVDVFRDSDEAHSYLDDEEEEDEEDVESEESEEEEEEAPAPKQRTMTPKQKTTPPETANQLVQNIARGGSLAKAGVSSAKSAARAALNAASAAFGNKSYEREKMEKQAAASDPIKKILLKQAEQGQKEVALKKNLDREKKAIRRIAEERDDFERRIALGEEQIRDQQKFVAHLREGFQSKKSEHEQRMKEHQDRHNAELIPLQHELKELEDDLLIERKRESCERALLEEQNLAKALEKAQSARKKLEEEKQHLLSKRKRESPVPMEVDSGTTAPVSASAVGDPSGSSGSSSSSSGSPSTDIESPGSFKGSPERIKTLDLLASCRDFSTLELADLKEYCCMVKQVCGCLNASEVAESLESRYGWDCSGRMGDIGEAWLELENDATLSLI